jgi:hypothetical protein
VYRLYERAGGHGSDGLPSEVYVLVDAELFLLLLNMNLTNQTREVVLMVLNPSLLLFYQVVQYLTGNGRSST